MGGGTRYQRQSSLTAGCTIFVALIINQLHLTFPSWLDPRWPESYFPGSRICTQRGPSRAQLLIT